MFGGTAKQAHKATLIAKIDSLAADIAKMASAHTEVLPLRSRARRRKVILICSVPSIFGSVPDLARLCAEHGNDACVAVRSASRRGKESSSADRGGCHLVPAAACGRAHRRAGGIIILPLSAPVPPRLCQDRARVPVALLDHTGRVRHRELPATCSKSLNSLHLRLHAAPLVRRCCRRKRPWTTPKRLLSIRVPPHASNSSKAWYLA